MRCVGEDERGSGGGRVARLVFSPGPRVVETLTLPVSRALFLSLCPKALVDGRGRLAFSRGAASVALERRAVRSRPMAAISVGASSCSPMPQIQGAGVGERERERERSATRVAGVWCVRGTLVLCRAPAMRDARTLSLSLSFPPASIRSISTCRAPGDSSYGGFTFPAPSSSPSPASGPPDSAVGSVESEDRSPLSPITPSTYRPSGRERD